MGGCQHSTWLLVFLRTVKLFSMQLLQVNRVVGLIYILVCKFAILELILYNTADQLGFRFSVSIHGHKDFHPWNVTFHLAGVCVGWGGYFQQL